MTLTDCTLQPRTGLAEYLQQCRVLEFPDDYRVDAFCVESPVQRAAQRRAGRWKQKHLSVQ